MEVETRSTIGPACGLREVGPSDGTWHTELASMASGTQNYVLRLLRCSHLDKTSTIRPKYVHLQDS